MKRIILEFGYLIVRIILLPIFLVVYFIMWLMWGDNIEEELTRGRRKI